MERKDALEQRSHMNPETHRIEPETENTPKSWRRLEIGEIVNLEEFQFRILAIDVAKQTIKLKVLKKG